MIGDERVIINAMGYRAPLLMLCLALRRTRRRARLSVARD